MNAEKHFKIAMIGAKGVPASLGGIERSVDELGSRLASDGHDVLVYCRRWYSQLRRSTYKGMRIIYAPTIHTKHLDTIVHTFFATVHALFSRVDIMHFHGVGPALFSWMPRLFAPSVRVVVSFQSIDREHAKWRWFAKKILHLGEWIAAHAAHELLASSHMIAQYVKDAYGVRAMYLPNGACAPDNSYTSGQGRAATRAAAFKNGFAFKEQETLAQYGLSQKQYLLVVTRLVPHKAVHEVIAAFLVAKKQNSKLMAHKKLAIVGDGHFTERYVARLKRMASGRRDIVFTGVCTGASLFTLMRNAYLAVHASHSEGMPMSVLEIMAQGTPALVSDIAPHKEMVRDERLLFPAGDVGQLARAILYAVSRPGFVAAAGEEARAHVHAQYSWDRIAAQLLQVYQATLGLSFASVRRTRFGFGL